jgi:precorrin-2 dehydrogenase/sirohydrochlorin ferrochelatase
MAVPAYYPVFLDLRDRQCVVFGGGDTGEEKAAKLLDYGANVVVISPDINDGLRGAVDGDRLTWIQRGYQPGDLEGAFIAIAADTGDSKTNKAVSTEARERNVPLNVVDITHLCTWIAPAVVRRGELIVAASTGGASPALARRFREELSGTSRVKSRLGLMEYADLAPLLSDARGELVRQGLKVSGDHWQACLTDDLVDLVQAGKTEEAKTLLMSRLLESTQCGCQDDVCNMWEDLAQAPGAEAGRAHSSTG